MRKNKFAQKLEEKFNFDVTALPAYTDEQSENFITDVVESSDFLGRLTLETGVKGKKTIKLLNADMTLQTMSGCTPEPDGAVTFTGRDLETKRLYVGIEFCNEDLNSKYTQILNVLGVKRQDATLPLEEILLAYLGKLLKRKAQRVIILGDTDSVDPDLLHFDGLLKRVKADASVNVAQSLETAFDSTNGYDILKTLYGEIPPEVFDDGLAMEIVTGRQEARACIDQVWNDKDFNAKIDATDENGSLSFELPTTATTVRTIPELNGTGEAIAFIYPYAFVGTDLEEDMDSLAIKYDDYDNKLKAEAMFRLGTNFVLPQYWTRLRLTPIS